MSTRDPRREALRRAEKRGAASGLRGLQKRRDRRERVRRFGEWHGRSLLLVGLVYLVCGATVGWAAALVVVGLLLLAAIVVRAAVTNGEVMLAVVSWLATMAVVSWLVVPAAAAAGPVGVLPVSAYTLPLAALFGPWVLRRHPANRGVTVVLGHLGCLGSTVVALWSVPVGVALGICWVVAVLVLRGGGAVSLRLLRARVRSRVAVPRGLRSHLWHRSPRPPVDDTGHRGFTDEWLEAGATAELHTAARLLELDADWTVLHSRELPGTEADVDHLAIGRPGVFLVDSKDWQGVISEQPVTPPEGGDPFNAYVLDGRTDRLAERVSPTTFEARRVAWGLGLRPAEVNIVVCFNDRMVMPEPVLEVEFRDVWDEVDRTVWDPRVQLVHVDHLVGWLLGQPPVTWRPRSRLRRSADRLLRRGEAVADVEWQRQFTRDLGVLADYAFPPKL